MSKVEQTLYNQKKGADSGPADESKLLRMSLSSTATGGLMDIGDLTNVWNRKDNVEDMDTNIQKEIEEKYKMGRFMVFEDDHLEDEFIQKFFHAAIKSHQLFSLIVTGALVIFVAMYVLRKSHVGIPITYALQAIIAFSVYKVLSKKWVHPYHMRIVLALVLVEILGLGIARYFTDFDEDKEYMLSISDARYLNVVYLMGHYSAIMSLRIPFKYSLYLTLTLDVMFLIIIAFFPGIGYLDYIESVIFIVLATGPMIVTSYKSELLNRRQEIRRAGILRHTEEVVKEKMVSEKLLLNILPNKIARRLMGGEEIISDGYTHVTVLFADLVGWTEIARSLPPTEAVGLLGEIVGNFDRLTQAYKVEKIKTIGDGYLVGCGLPDPLSPSSSAKKMASFALDMLRAVEGLSVMKRRNIQVTIGIHTGPVVAGVIGKTKFLYDLWGDSVNTASRMQSHGETGKIHVTSEFQELLKTQFEFEKRSMIEVKGKGLMQTYYLLGKSTHVVSSTSSHDNIDKQAADPSAPQTATHDGVDEKEDKEEGEDKKLSAAERKKRKAREAMRKRNEELDLVLQSKIKFNYKVFLTFTEPDLEKEFRLLQEAKGNEVVFNVTLLYILIAMIIGPNVLQFENSVEAISDYYMWMGGCAIFQVCLLGVAKLRPDLGYLMNIYSVISFHAAYLGLFTLYRMQISYGARFMYQIIHIFGILTFMSSRIPYRISTFIVLGTFFLVAALCKFLRDLDLDTHSLLYYATLAIYGQVTATQVEKFARRDFLMSHLADEERKKVMRQREESERLLHNILPESVIEKMRGGDGRLIDTYENATVLFADIVGFTILSSKLDAKSIVTMLNNLFSQFDSYAEEKGLEKIKTIGDAYMVVCGLPYPRPDHAKVTIQMGLEMARIVAAYPDIEGLRVNIRIGIHSGNVVGGIVGLSKMVFDIWGENVNVASKMESNGTPGCVNVSHVTRTLLGEDPDIEFEDRQLAYNYGGQAYNMFYAKPRSAPTGPTGAAADW
eukprot:TRINITY_DN218_c0_g1_i1.p1 TRINITY_DN218_c0_g1~~TRINITY_DN218_c0_g1_i1.p1  ORF type:complete len:1005 (-),score=206.08 TRINITY_DN218_c0_g1_i1:560-3574(-)